MDYRLPVYQQIKGLILSRIENKEYLPGEMIPSERTMAATFKVNRMTVKNAVNSLVSEGVLFRVQGKGTFVMAEKDKIFSFNQGGNSFTAKAKSANLILTSKTLNFELLEGHTYLCEKLGLDPNSNIFALSRVRYGNGAPLAIEHAFIPAELFSDIYQYNFEHISLYDYMDSKGHIPNRFDQSLMVLEAYDGVAKYLEIEEGTGVFLFEYISYDQSGTIVEYSKSFLRTDKVSFSFQEYSE